jgi:phosphopantothenate synthetase
MSPVLQRRSLLTIAASGLQEEVISITGLLLAFRDITLFRKDARRVRGVAQCLQEAGGEQNIGLREDSHLHLTNVQKSPASTIGASPN